MAACVIELFKLTMKIHVNSPGLGQKTKHQLLAIVIYFTYFIGYGHMSEVEFSIQSIFFVQSYSWLDERRINI